MTVPSSVEQRQREKAAAQNGHPPDRTVYLRVASTIAPEAVDWAWDGRIPLGAVTLLVGTQGLGKTTLLVEVIARLSRGDLPGGLSGTPTRSVIATAEDALANTLVPRLTAADADLAQVAFVDIGTDGTTLTLPDDVERLVEAAGDFEAKVIAIDPFSAFLSGSVDAHRDTDVRRTIAPLAGAAEERGLAVVPVLHLNKGESRDVLTRTSGSVAFTAAARSVLFLGADPDDPDGEASAARILANAKNNLAPRAPSLACRIEGRAIGAGDGQLIPTSQILIGDERDVTANDLLKPTGQADESEAGAFLVAELADGPVPTKDLLARGKKARFSQRTLERTKTAIGITAQRRGFDDGSHWAWSLPDDDDEGRAA